MGIFNRLLGKAKDLCPICKDNIIKWPPNAMEPEVVCQNCGATFFKEWFFENKIFMAGGKGEYLHKLLTEEGWEIVRKGYEPFMCPGCGTQPTPFKKYWRGSLAENEGCSLKCGFCGRALLIKDNQVVEELSDKVSESPKYEVVTLSRSIKWPDNCCVCLEQPVTQGPHSILGKRAYGSQMLKYEATIDVPYCKSHLKKRYQYVEGELLVSGSFGIIGVRIRFPNPKFVTMFRQLNPLVHLNLTKGSKGAKIEIYPVGEKDAQ